MLKIRLDQALKENFTEEDLLNTIQSNNLEKKFILSLQLIFKTDKSDFGWNLLKTLDLSSLIDESFIEDSLNSSNSTLSSQNFLKFIIFIQQVNSTNMAIQKHLSNYAPQKPQDNGNHIDIKNILEVIERIEHRQEKLSTSQLIVICEMMIKEMSKLPFPREADELRIIGPHIARIGEFFKKLSIPNDDRLRFLELIYTFLTNTANEPTAFISIGFLIIPDVMITQALEYFFKALQWSGKKTQDSIIVAMGRLISWLRTSNMPVPLETWIIQTIVVLSNNGFYDIIDEVAKKNIVPAFLTLLVPVFQSKTLPVVQSLFCCSRNTKELLDNIAPRVCKVLKQLEQTESKIFEPLMELICDSLGMVTYCDAQYKEIMNFLELRNRSPTKVIKKFTGPMNYACLTSNNARVGLENLGNTCYLNSILQALFMTKQFSREILTAQRSDRTVFELQKLFALMLCSPRPEQNPNSVINLIRPDDFLPGIQHDSSEFLGSLLDRLHEQEKKRLKDDEEDWDNDPNSNCSGAATAAHTQELPKMMHTDSPMIDDDDDDDDNNNNEDDKIENNPVPPKDKIIDNATNLTPTYIQRIFGGKMCTRYLCSSCNSNSINVDFFRDLQLSFPEKAQEENFDTKYNVQQLLEYYFSTEELNLVGDNQYHCDNCKILCNGMRCTEILEPPRNLILTLKHFRYDSRHHTRSKLLYHVHLDEIITVNVKTNSFMSNGTRNVDYKLYAAVVHSGTSLDSGHYYTIARESDTKWFKFNDSYVTKSSLDELRSLISPNTPYILFYQRLSTASATVVQSESASTSSAMFTNQNNDSFPEYDELSPFLRDFINEDKTKYENDTASQKNQMAYGRMYPMRDNFDDNDPSSGSSYNINDSYAHNRFIY